MNATTDAGVCVGAGAGASVGVSEGKFKNLFEP